VCRDLEPGKTASKSRLLDRIGLLRTFAWPEIRPHRSCDRGDDVTVFFGPLHKQSKSKRGGGRQRSCLQIAAVVQVNINYSEEDKN
jgi:hypothetical protein